MPISKGASKVYWWFMTTKTIGLLLNVDAHLNHCLLVPRSGPIPSISNYNAEHPLLQGFSLAAVRNIPTMDFLWKAKPEVDLPAIKFSEMATLWWYITEAVAQKFFSRPNYGNKKWVKFVKKLFFNPSFPIFVNYYNPILTEYLCKKTTLNQPFLQH